MDLQALIRSNVRRRLAELEPNPRRQLRKLSDLLGVDRSVAHRHLDGVATVSVLQRLAKALGVSPVSLLDAPAGSEVVAAQVDVEGEQHGCRAWLLPTLTTPYASDTLLAVSDSNGWQVNRFHRRRQAGRLVSRLDIIARPGPDDMPDSGALSAVISRNVRRLLTLYERDPRHQLRTLATLLSVHRSAAHRHMHGVSTIKVLGQLAEAFGVSPVALLSSAACDIDVVRARVDVDGAQYDCYAWLGTLEDSGTRVMRARQDGSVYRVGRYGPGRSVLRLDVITRVVVDDKPTIAIHCTDTVFSAEVAHILGDSGYLPAVYDDDHALLYALRPSPDDPTSRGSCRPAVLILNSPTAELLADQACRIVGDVVQTLVVTSDIRHADPVNGRFFVEKNAIRILVALRALTPGQRA